MLAISYEDISHSSTRPQRCQLRVLFAVAAVQASIACISSWLLLWAVMGAAQDENGNAGSWLYRLGIVGMEGLTPGHIVSMMALQVPVTNLLTALSVRTHNNSSFLWTAPSRPHGLVLAMLSISLVLTTLLAVFWPVHAVDYVTTMGLAYGSGRDRSSLFIICWVWLYCILICIVQDIAKTGMHKLLFRYNIFGYRCTVAAVDAPSTRMKSS
ncbi:P-type H+-ATPase, putative [Bodo saltans]|uniref:P-type H+-ATPase, putative n=1 Tax=Bodo saltans TaxID=75058 RepID=A0A0S4JRU5_BODSA|nr:P-type H+-ATPase, putative [Bodo saltans]|eukprot:CUG92917.1 P-type H+-ATPase, putative [Bodo saltans]